MTKYKLTFGIIGDGISAFRHAHEICIKPDLRLLALSYKDKEKGIETAKRHYIEALYDDGEYLIKREEIDVVVLSVPTRDHAFWLRSTLDYSKIVVVESPLTHSLYEGKEFLELVDEGYFIFNCNPYLYMMKIPKDRRRHHYRLTISSSTFDEGDMLLVALETVIFYFGKVKESYLTEDGVKIVSEDSEGEIVRERTTDSVKMSLILDGEEIIKDKDYYDSLSYFYSFLLTRLEKGGSIEKEIRVGLEALEIQNKLFSTK